MNEHSNNFRFLLKQGDTLLCEMFYDADMFSPYTRYSINIRSILPRAITKLQKVLSKKNYNTVLELGRVDTNDDESDMLIIDNLEYVQSLITSYPDYQRFKMRYLPQAVCREIEEKTIRGVECKIGLYINNNPIVERDFYVDGFNPNSRYSLDVVNTVVEIGNTIFDNIRENDINNIWDDFDIINALGYTINQIRELSVSERVRLLNRLK